MSKDKDINEKNAENTSLISYSIAHGRNEIFHYLYNHGADINIIDKRGWSSIFYAAYFKNNEVLNILEKKNKEDSCDIFEKKYLDYKIT